MDELHRAFSEVTAPALILVESTCNVAPQSSKIFRIFVKFTNHLDKEVANVVRWKNRFCDINLNRFYRVQVTVKNGAAFKTDCELVAQLFLVRFVPSILKQKYCLN